MSTNKILTVVFCAVIAVSLLLAGAAFFMGSGNDAPEEETVPGLTVVRAPAQTEAVRPPGFPDPEENWIKLPDGPNLAEGKPVTSGEHTEVFEPANTVDGDLNSYWESKGIPAEITIDLEAVYTVQTVGVRLNPVPIWEARTQTFEILVSADGAAFTSVVPDTRYEFDPDTGNLARADFDPVPARYVKLIFSAKSSGRSNGAQAAEIVIFE
ncbi:MAG: discoidin domain-containing protein [Oscillospiraceae bacterium]|nr:discoidin domain-containing protein [Oscillospiraceae bacterium]